MDQLKNSDVFHLNAYIYLGYLFDTGRCKALAPLISVVMKVLLFYYTSQCDNYFSVTVDG